MTDALKVHITQGAYKETSHEEEYQQISGDGSRRQNRSRREECKNRF
jgi:hypothetical protein